MSVGLACKVLTCLRPGDPAAARTGSADRGLVQLLGEVLLEPATVFRARNSTHKIPATFALKREETHWKLQVFYTWNFEP